MRQRSNLHWSNVVCRPWAIVVYNVEPTLDQCRNVIWAVGRSVTLAFADFEKFILEVDDCTTGDCAVLYKKDDDLKKRPLCYASRKHQGQSKATQPISWSFVL